MKRKNMSYSLVVAAAIFGFIALVPMPFHVDCAVEIQPHDASQVFALVPGKLVKWHKRPGTAVEQNELIAELDNLDVRYEYAKYQGEVKIAEDRLEVLDSLKNDDPEARALYKTQVDIVASAKAKLAEAAKRTALLEVRSSVKGVVMSVPSKQAPKQADDEIQLPGWTGNPFDEKNQSAFFSESDPLCMIGDPQRMEAVLVVDQSDIDLVKMDHEVDIKIDSARLETFSGRVRQISEMEMKSTPESLASQTGGRLDTEMDASGKLRPISTSYQARVPLENVEVPLRAGYRGQAKIYVGWKSWGWRVMRFLIRTFRFEF